jgi:hypothetical protein
MERHLCFDLLAHLMGKHTEDTVLRCHPETASANQFEINAARESVPAPMGDRCGLDHKQEVRASRCFLGPPLEGRDDGLIKTIGTYLSTREGARKAFLLQCPNRRPRLVLDS